MHACFRNRQSSVVNHQSSIKRAMAKTKGLQGWIIGLIMLGSAPFFVCRGVPDGVGAIRLWTIVREPGVVSNMQPLEASKGI